MKKIDIDKLKVSSKLDDVINSAISEGYKNINGNKEKKTNRKIRKSIIAASLTVGILTTGIIATPAIAANIPIIGDIYKQLGFFKGFEEYTNYIGETKEVAGYKFTIDNIIGTKTDILVGVKIESPVPLRNEDDPKKNQNFMVNLDMSSFGLNSLSSGGEVHYIDDYTAILTCKMENVEGKFKKFGDMTITVRNHPTSQEEFKEIRADFNIKYDFTSSFNSTEQLKVNKKVDDLIKVHSIETSKLSTKVVFKANSKGTSIEGRMFERISNIYYLSIDGKLHKQHEGMADGSTAQITFPTVRYDDIKNAKNVDVICAIPSEDTKDEDLYNKVEIVNENNITYPKLIISKSGLKGEIYKVERVDNKLKFYFESEYNAISLFNSLNLFEMRTENQKLNDKMLEGIAYKDNSKENGYIFEFKDVNFNKPLELLFWEEATNLDKIKEVKIIKVK